MNAQRRDLFKIHGAVLLFGLAGLFARWVALPAALIVLGRVFFSTLFLLISSACAHTPLKLHKKSHYMGMALSGALLAVHWTSFMLSIQRSSVAVGTLTFSTFPLFVILLEPVFFHEKLRIRDIFMGLIMLCGVALIGFHEMGSPSGGLMWGLVSSVTYAALSLANRKFSGEYPAGVVAAYEQGYAFFCLLPALRLPGVPTVRDVILLALLGVIFTAVAHTLFIAGMRTVKARTAGMISGLESVYGIFAACVLLGEFPSLFTLLGGALILGVAFYSAQNT